MHVNTLTFYNYKLSYRLDGEKGNNMNTQQIFELGIINDDTEIFIRNDVSTTGFEILAKGNWYEDHILEYSNEKYPVVSFTWQDNNKLYIDITAGNNITEVKEVMLFNNVENAEYTDSKELLKRKDIRYIGTDYELSNYDLYENIYTGELYATTL